MCAELSRRFSINPLFWTGTLTESNSIFICEDCPLPPNLLLEIKSSMRMNDSYPNQVYARANLKLGPSIGSMSHFLTTQLLGGETKEIFKQQSATFFSLSFEKHKVVPRRRGSSSYYESVQFLLFFGLSESMQSVIIKDFLGCSELSRNTDAFEVHFILARRITNYAEEFIRSFSEAICRIEKVCIYSIFTQPLNAIHAIDLE